MPEIKKLSLHIYLLLTLWNNRRPLRGVARSVMSKLINIIAPHVHGKFVML